MNHRGVRVGALLGLLNTLFVAVAFAVSTDIDDRPLLAFVIVLFGILPGVITGMILGALANAIAARHVVLRSFALAVPAAGAMLGWSAFFGLAERFALGVIPTVVCALILERSTRAKSELPAAAVL